MSQILHTNKEYVNVKVDPWVHDICTKKNYKIKHHETPRGPRFTINKKPFASLFFKRTDEFNQHTMMRRIKINKKSSYGPVVDKKGFIHNSQSEKNKVELYDLTMSNFVNAVAIQNPLVTNDLADDSILDIPLSPDNSIRYNAYIKISGDILYESQKTGIPHEVVLYNIIEKLIERVNN